MKRSKRIEGKGGKTNNVKSVESTATNKVDKRTKTKVKQLKVKRKLTVKEKSKKASEEKEENSDINFDDIDIILNDLQSKFIAEKKEMRTESTICVKLEDFLQTQTAESSSSKEKQRSNKKQGKHNKQLDESKQLDEYKKKLLLEIERKEKLSQHKYTPYQSTSCTNTTSLPSLVNIQTNSSSDRDDTVNDSQESVVTCYNVLPDPKKRKIIINGEEDEMMSTNDTNYSTLEEDDWVEKVVGTEKKQKALKKRKRVNKKYRVKNSDNDLQLGGDSEAEQTANSTSNLTDETSDIVVEEMNDVDPPEDIRYIPVDFHDDFHGILFLSQNQVVAMNGYMQLTVVSGEVDVSGYRMTGGQDLLAYVDVFSVSTSSLFYIKDTTPAPCSSEQREKLITEHATIFQSTREEMAELFCSVQEVYACVIVKKLYSVLPALLKKLDNFKALPQEPIFIPEPFHIPVLSTEQWSVTYNEIESDMNMRDDCNCSIMLCGASNVGKSSLARYTINRLLKIHDEVFFLDCDCGQTEFTPPSVLSLVKVTKPLLGLPFSHQMNPVNSYFYGHISPGSTPAEYIKLIGYLFQLYYVDCYSQGPLVINTQGWMQGLGLSLLVDCIRLTSPCHIIHINAPSKKNNIPKHFNEELVEREGGWDIDSSYKCIKNGHGCTYHNLCTTDTQNNSSLGKNKSRMSRNQCITSYFSSLYQPGLDEFILKGKKCSKWIPPPMSVLLPYVVRWEDVALHVMHEKVTPDLMLFAFNLALVGLARVDPELITARDEDSKRPNYLLNQPVADYIGFGIIRNIDVSKQLFYILTPEPVERLKNVNALLKGSALLPTSYLREDVDSNQPYYCTDYITVASKTASGMKPRYNLKRRPSKMRGSNVE